ncbi:MAG: filamentous hemagglutinin N-terminal domain-containing protein [Nitrospira sp.]|nr:filamentous hemagglutinin N-terminal domain-containing protein [Nitrospira sp.]
MRYTGPFRQVLICILAICVTHLTSISPKVSAQTAPITSSGLNTQISAPIQVDGQTQYNITGGTRPNGGPNLFHSFGEFGIPNNSIANFENTSGLATSNILGRVTGGNESHILGTLRISESFGNTDLFLMNPAGFLFAPNATINAEGMVSFTSADYLKLEDGRTFNATPHSAADALLSASPVAAFGFLDSSPGAIIVRGSKFNGANISLVGGNITIESGTPSGGPAQQARLSAANGTIQLAGAASPGAFDVALQSIQNVNDASFTSFGTVSLAPGSTINVGGTDTVSIRGGQFVLSVKDASLSTAANAGDSNSVSLNTDSSIVSSTASTEAGPDIQIDAATITLKSFVTITAVNSDSLGGNVGNIALQAAQQITAVDAVLNTDTGGGTGQSGNILLRAPTISIDGGVLSATARGTTRAGNVLLEGQHINLRTSPFAAAQGLVQGADLFTGTSGQDDGGTIALRGLDGPLSHAHKVAISGSSNVHTLTSSGGDAGDIRIQTARFILTDNATLKADTFGSGDAGRITIVAIDHATISGPSTAISSSSDLGATGHAGLVTVSAPIISIENGGRLSTNTTGYGTGGNIDIAATRSITLSSGARVSANSIGSGNAGNIWLDGGQQLIVRDSPSAIATQATRSSGGDIDIRAVDRIQLTNSEVIASVSDGPGGGGNIFIDPKFVILQNGRILSQTDQGTGGSITITANVFLPDTTSIVNADAHRGVNGTVTIQSPNAPASGKFQPLTNRPLQATSLLNQRCAAVTGGEFSSFTMVGRGNLPAELGGWLSSPLALATPAPEISSMIDKGQGLSRNEPTGNRSPLSLRQIAPPGFLTRTFAIDKSTDCVS